MSTTKEYKDKLDTAVQWANMYKLQFQTADAQRKIYKLLQ